MSKPLIKVAFLLGMTALSLASFAEPASMARKLPARNKGKTAPLNKPTPLPPVKGATATVQAPTLDFPLDPAGKNHLVISKISRPDGLFLTATDNRSQTVWTSTNLGSEEKKFLLENKLTVLGLKDMTGDGQPELLSSGFYGPSASGLYIFAWDTKKRTFTGIPNTASGTPELFPHLVSDVPVESGDDMVVEADGTIRLLGRVFDPKAENPPATGIYSYRFIKDCFVLQTIEVLPAPPELK